MRIEQLQREFEIECSYRPFPLHPETPDEGMSLEQLFGGRIDLPAALSRLSQVAESLTLPLSSRSHTYNSRNAQELGLWVTEQGQFKAYLDAVYQAYFVSGINISRPEELLKIVDHLKLDSKEALQILETHSYSAALDQEWDKVLTSGIRAVPTLRYKGRELVGFQSEENCRQLLVG